MLSLQIHGQDWTPQKGNSFCKYSSSTLPISINNLSSIRDSVICRSNNVKCIKIRMSFTLPPKEFNGSTYSFLTHTQARTHTHTRAHTHTHWQITIFSWYSIKKVKSHDNIISVYVYVTYDIYVNGAIQGILCCGNTYYQYLPWYNNSTSKMDTIKYDYLFVIVNIFFTTLKGNWIDRNYDFFIIYYMMVMIHYLAINIIFVYKLKWNSGKIEKWNCDTT